MGRGLTQRTVVVAGGGDLRGGQALGVGVSIAILWVRDQPVTEHPMPNHLGTVRAKDVKVHPRLVKMLEQTVRVPIGLGQPVHVAEALGRATPARR